MTDARNRARKTTGTQGTEIFGYLRKSSENARKMLGNICQAFWNNFEKSLEKSSESSQKSSENRQNVVISMFI